MARNADLLAKGLALHKEGRLDAAEKNYLSALKTNRNNPDAHYLLGILRLERGEVKRAAGHLADAVAAAEKAGRPVDPGWRLALGSALQQTGDHLGALKLFEQVLRERPGSLDAMFCRATALYETGRRQEAISAYEALLQAAPNHAESANNLGVAYSEAGRPTGAIRAFRRAVEIRPDYLEALCNLGGALSNRGQAHNAVSVLRRAAEAMPDHASLQLTFFESLIESGMVDELEARARAALPRHTGNAEILAMLGSALQFQGRNDEARTFFAEAAKIDRECSRAQQGLAELEEPEDRDKAIRQLRAYLDARSESDSVNPGLWFALAVRYKRAGQLEDAFGAFAVANGLRRAEMEARGYAYDRVGREAEVAAIREAFPPGSLALPGASDSEIPVFIVGMPRSGTTLVEQVLAAHPEVFGAGELGHIQRVATLLKAEHGFPGRTPPPEVLTDVSGRYLAVLRQLSGGKAQRVTDKMPQNFNHLGLISLLFPNARIIHCRRDPMDTCLSCFEQNFRAGGLSWSCDLADTGHYYCQYRHVMAHWRTALPVEHMLEIDYEDTVANLEAQARRIVDFVGLPWNDACLGFHETNRAVVTASRSQVRSPVYSSSVGRWRRYGSRVTPLATALAECGCAPE